MARVIIVFSNREYFKERGEQYGAVWVNVAPVPFGSLLAKFPDVAHVICLFINTTIKGANMGQYGKWDNHSTDHTSVLLYSHIDHKDTLTP